MQDARLSALATLTRSERMTLRLLTKYEGGVTRLHRVQGVTAASMHNYLLSARQKLLFSETASLLVWLVASGVDLDG